MLQVNCMVQKSVNGVKLSDLIRHGEMDYNDDNIDDDTQESISFNVYVLVYFA